MLSTKEKYNTLVDTAILDRINKSLLKLFPGKTIRPAVLGNPHLNELIKAAVSVYVRGLQITTLDPYSADTRHVLELFSGIAVDTASDSDLEAYTYKVITGKTLTK